MATLEERVGREEGRSEQFDMRLEELSVEMRSGFDSLDRTIESGFERTDRAIQQTNEAVRGLHRLLVGLLVALISGLVTIVVLLLIVIVNPLS